MSDFLFDPEPYTRGDVKRSKVTTQRPVTLEPIEDGWSLIATRLGPEPYQHAVKADIRNGAVRTECDLVGRLFGADVPLAERCPTCARQIG